MELHELVGRRLGGRGSCVWIALAWVAIVSLAILVGSDAYQKHQVESWIEVDAEIAAGKSVEVFPGSEVQGGAREEAIQPGRRTTYVFKELPAVIEQLRIDFTDLPGTRVRLCRVTVRRAGQIVRSLTPAELRPLRWSEVSLMPSDPAAPDACIELVTTGAEPCVRIPPPSLGEHPLWVVRKLQFLRAESWLFLAGPALLFLLWRWRSVGLLLLAPTLLMVLVRLEGRLFELWPLRVLLPGYQSSDVAVGNANYIGYPKLADHRIVVLSVLITALVSYVAARSLRSLPRLGPPLLSAQPATTRITVWVWGAVLGCLVLINVGLRLPDIVGLHRMFLHDPTATDFDSTNHFTWGYAYWSGWVPLRDFWYPYADFIQHWAWTAGGFARALLHLVLTWAVIGRCVFVLSNRSYRFTAVVFAFVAVAAAGWLLMAELRYNLSLALVMLGLVSQRRGWQLRDALWLAVMAGYSLPYEVHQTVYAAVPIGVLWLIDLVDQPAFVTRRRMLHWLAAFGIAFLFFAAVWLIDLARQGRLQAQLDFLVHSAGMVAYASQPSNIGEWFLVPSYREALLLYFMLMAIGLGVGARVWARRGALADIGTICLACGLLAALTIQKQIVRPHIANQLLPQVVLPLLFWLLALYRAAPRFSERAAIVFLTVLSLTVGFGIGPWRFAVEHSRARAELVPAGIALLRDSAGWEAAHRHYYLAPDRYPGMQPLIQRLRELIGPDPGGQPTGTRFFVLGDEAYLYVALHQKPAPYITLYDASPLSAQEGLVRWLHEQQPEYVVFRPQRATFDDVPNVVRVPRLYSAIVGAYEPFETLGDTHILRRRPPSRPIDWAYFRNRLGTSVSLGALPAHSRLGALPVCRESTLSTAPANAEHCAPVLHVQVAAPVAKQPLTLVLTAAGHEFAVSLQQQAGIKDYAIALSSLWFWPHLSAQAAPPLDAWRVPAGVTLQLSQRTGAARILF